jgi:hypothetical protein
MTAKTMERAIASYFDWRANLIVPNVSWGLFLHECDLLILSGKGYATEVEIKISAGDLKKDLKKYHGHYDNRIKYLYFAIPPKLLKYIEYIPKRAGILIVTSSMRVFEVTKPEQNTNAKAFTDEERYKMARLGALRIWNLKADIENLKLQIKSLKSGAGTE